MFIVNQWLSKSSGNHTDIIAIIISVLSLILSLFIAWRTWWVERFKLDLEMVKWYGVPRNNNKFFWLYITNYSKLPCSVLEVKISVERNGELIEAYGSGYKKQISTSYEDKEELKKNYSLDYPAKIDPHTSIGGYFHVVSKYGISAFEEQWVNITIRTSRGSITKKVFLDYGKNVYRVIVNRKELKENKIISREDGSIIKFLEDDDIN